MPARTHAALTAIGPLPYLSAADSPFASDPSLTTVLEDFEDGALNVPGIVNVPVVTTPPYENEGRGVVMTPGISTDSVDGDDGAIDGSGNGGHSLKSTLFSSVSTLPATYSSALNFNFQPIAGGQYPTAFGFAWTDGEPESYVSIFVLERNAISGHFVGFPAPLGDQSALGESAEDRFFGVVSDVGIQRIVIESLYFARSETDDGTGRRQFFELDHLQFSYPRVPEASTATLILIGASLTLLCRR